MPACCGAYQTSSIAIRKLQLFAGLMPRVTGKASAIFLSVNTDSAPDRSCGKALADPKGSGRLSHKASGRSPVCDDIIPANGIRIRRIQIAAARCFSAGVASFDHRCGIGSALSAVSCPVRRVNNAEQASCRSHRAVGVASGRADIGGCRAVGNIQHADIHNGSHQSSRTVCSGHGSILSLIGHITHGETDTSAINISCQADDSACASGRICIFAHRHIVPADSYIAKGN